MIVSDFDVKKAAQVVAFFARASGGRINVLKLIKLVYLADREFAKRYDEPMLDDHWVSMAHGPVNSGTLDMINGLGAPDPIWDAFIGRREGNDIRLARDLSDADFDELSVADVEVLAHTWLTLGHLDRYQIRDYTHKNCPEWEDPHGSSYPIPYARLFKYLGRDDAEGLEEMIESIRALNRTFQRNADASRDYIPAE